jgi:hypothetical protein
MPSIGFWKKRIHKFIDYPPALFPFLRKSLYHNFIADEYLTKFKDINFLDYSETIDYIIDNEKSIVRFGDELMDMFMGIGLYYDDWHQKYDKKLVKRLKEVMNTKDERLLIGLHWQFFTKTKKQLSEENIPPQIWTNSKVFLHKYLNKNNTYGSALCFQPKFNKDIDFTKILKYFSKKHIIIVTGNAERFDGVNIGKTTDFVPCPKNDSWKNYDQIFADTISLVKNKGYKKKDTLFLISLASAAKVFVMDLLKQDYQGWDTGQFFDLAFEEIKNK